MECIRKFWKGYNSRRRRFLLVLFFRTCSMGHRRPLCKKRGRWISEKRQSAIFFVFTKKNNNTCFWMANCTCKRPTKGIAVFDYKTKVDITQFEPKVRSFQKPHPLNEFVCFTGLLQTFAMATELRTWSGSPLLRQTLKPERLLVFLAFFNPPLTTHEELALLLLFV